MRNIMHDAHTMLCFIGACFACVLVVPSNVAVQAGDVLTKESYDKCVKPEGHWNGIKLRKGDVIDLQRGGTGFSLHDGKSIESSKYWYLGPGSGMADLRGQHQGPRSATGLIFMN